MGDLFDDLMTVSALATMKSFRPVPGGEEARRCLRGEAQTVTTVGLVER